MLAIQVFLINLLTLPATVGAPPIPPPNYDNNIAKSGLKTVGVGLGWLAVVSLIALVLAFISLVSQAKNKNALKTNGQAIGIALAGLLAAGSLSVVLGGAQTVFDSIKPG